jgi:hypothetical protein
MGLGLLGSILNAFGRLLGCALVASQTTWETCPKRQADTDRRQDRTGSGQGPEEQTIDSHLA